VLNPFQILAILEGCFELFHIFVEHNICAGGSGGAKLFSGGRWSNGVEEFVIEADFLCLNLRQPIDGIERGYFFQELRLYVLRPFASGTNGEVDSQVGQSPHGSSASSTLMRGSTAEARMAMLAPEPCAKIPIRFISRSPRASR
jgi:hypothetical protein